MLDVQCMVGEFEIVEYVRPVPGLPSGVKWEKMNLFTFCIVSSARRDGEANTLLIKKLVRAVLLCHSHTGKADYPSDYRF